MKFVEENINIVKPKIDIEDIEQKLENSFDKKEDIIAVANEEIVITQNTSALANEEIVENEEILAVANEETAEIENIPASTNEIIIEDKPILEEEILAVANDEIVEKEIIIEENEPIFVPEFELEKPEVKPEPVQISFDEFKFEEPIFEKKSEIKEEKPIILNEKLSRGINIGLNDKIAFVKHLFGESNEDYIRVLSQISTFDTYLETVNFINDFVKPDYNNWVDKDEYILRFMEAIEKKFV